MSSEIAVRVENVSKAYPIFEAPADRLKQMLVPRLQRLAKLPVGKYYREYWALRDVAFDVRRGGTVGILGRNGAGKSTLLQIISGIMDPTGGSVSVNGRVSALLELGTGFNPEFTGRQNVILAGQLKGVSEEEMHRRFDEIASFADIGEFIEHPVKTYSSGMLVRLAFSVHAILDPDILIVDEALAVGDVRFQSKCYDWIAQLKARGTSILFVTHDVSAVRRFCERAVWLEGGSCAACGNAFDVSTAYTEFMLGGTKRTAVLGSAAEISVDGREKLSAPEATLSPALFAERFPYTPERHNPLRRWGSHIGVIRAVEITNAQCEPVVEFDVGSQIQIHVVTDLPSDIPRDGLSIGFGIRSVDGQDIVVRSTYDCTNLRDLPNKTSVHVVFALDNILGEGDYRLAVTLENRAPSIPSYYDFIEGAIYFKSKSARYRWGIVVPEVLAAVVG